MNPDANIKNLKAGSDWYKGDLHMRARQSAGTILPHITLQRAVLAELDFCVPEGYGAFSTDLPKSPVSVFPGLQMNTQLGQVGLFGTDAIPYMATQDFAVRMAQTRAEDEAFIRDIVSESKNHGWPICMNHPFRQGQEWKFTDFCLPDLNCLEIISDPACGHCPDADIREDNEKAIAFSDLLWEDGYRICAIGGSACGRPARDDEAGDAQVPLPGDPATWLYMESLCADAMKKALYGCSAYVSRHCSLRTELVFGTRLPQEQAFLHYEIHLRDYRKKPDIFYKHNGMKILCGGLVKEPRGWCVRGSIFLNPSVPYHCIRFGAQGEDGSFLFYANPITRGRREHRFLTFGDAQRELERLPAETVY